MPMAVMARNEKGSHEGLPLGMIAGQRQDHFLMLMRANLLRNFSTRPPKLSTLFCVPV